VLSFPLFLNLHRQLLLRPLLARLSRRAPPRRTADRLPARALPALELRRGIANSDRQLIDRLNDLGYAKRVTLASRSDSPSAANAVSILPRSADSKSDRSFVFQRRGLRSDRGRAPPNPAASAHRVQLSSSARTPRTSGLYEAPCSSSLVAASRENRRPSPRGDSVSHDAGVCSRRDHPSTSPRVLRPDRMFGGDALLQPPPAAYLAGAAPLPRSWSQRLLPSSNA